MLPEQAPELNDEYDIIYIVFNEPIKSSIIIHYMPCPIYHE
jgi:hypothetical protein